MTMQRTIIALTLAGGIAALGAPAFAQEHDAPPPRVKWSFAGPFGKFDEAQLQRGFKVYREVCANCHSLDMVAFRNLGDPGALGYSTAQVAVVAALLAYEHSLVRPSDLRRLNAAFFTVNGYISLLFLLFWGAAVWVESW